ncbi:hypothetical protein Ddye_019033 [Dipteronia dyeriana]|uniref:RRM domain-containing protein n=1 Tax=Dipteronia dyeriana TaxID=168575 RepID=A0AAD9TXY6_9ROSI|nr:hypothetical protein Ddye_019033 [Dipteronia dyeriana]
MYKYYCCFQISIHSRHKSPPNYCLVKTRTSGHSFPSEEVLLAWPCPTRRTLTTSGLSRRNFKEQPHLEPTTKHVLVFGYDLVKSSVLDNFITYFTDKPTEYHLVKAAELATVLEGVSASLGMVVAYMLDAHFSNLIIISCSIASTIIGLVLFTLNLMIWRGRYEFVYIIGIFLLAVGKGVRPQLSVFLADQLRGHEPADTNTNKYPVKVQKRVWLIVAWLCSVAATFFISDFSRKKVLFPSTSVLVVTFILFLCGIPVYHSKKFTGAGSSLFNLIPVFKVSVLKRHIHYPSYSEHYFYDPDTHDYQRQTHLSPQVKILRWLDKAAIIESSNLDPQDQKEAGRLCTCGTGQGNKTSSKNDSNMEYLPCDWFGFSADGLDEFMIDELPKSLQKYASVMNEFVIDGLGSFLGIPFMFSDGFNYGGRKDFRDGLVSIFIGNLNPEIDSMGLWGIFKVFGKVRDVYLSSKKNFNGSVFAFIRFGTLEEAGKVAKNVNGMHVYGRPIVAKVATYD